MLQYQLIATPLEQLRTRYQVTEGLEYRIKDCLHATSFAEFMALLKTKRYTRTRLQRLMCYLLFQATSEEVQQAQKNTGIRILGFTTAGQTYLKQVKRRQTCRSFLNLAKGKRAFWVFFTGRSNLSVGITTDCRTKFWSFPYFSKELN